MGHIEEIGNTLFKQSFTFIDSLLPVQTCSDTGKGANNSHGTHHSKT